MPVVFTPGYAGILDNYIASVSFTKVGDSKPFYTTPKKDRF
jgi:hypothetical protein